MFKGYGKCFSILGLLARKKPLSFVVIIFVAEQQKASTGVLGRSKVTVNGFFNTWLVDVSRMIMQAVSTSGLIGKAWIWPLSYN